MPRRLNEQLAGAAPGGAGYQPWGFPGWLTTQQIDRARRWLIVAGILALIIGLLSIAIPVIASVTIAVFVGWILVAAGLTLAIHAISHRAPFRALEALVTLVAGIYVLVFPLSGTVTLTFVLAVWFFASGTLSLAYAWQWRGIPGAWMHALGGVVSVILGFLIAASLPSSAAWAIGLLVGINLVLWGLRALIGARLLKELVGPGRPGP